MVKVTFLGLNKSISENAGQFKCSISSEIRQQQKQSLAVKKTLHMFFQKRPLKIFSTYNLILQQTITMLNYAIIRHYIISLWKYWK